MYKPTLGGLKKLQQFMEKNYYPMPIFQIGIFQDGRVANGKWELGKGKKVSINEAIRKQGVNCRVIDVRIASEKGDRFIQFVDPIHLDLTSYIYGPRGAKLEFSKGEPVDEQFIDFMQSHNRELYAIARWGNDEPSVIDWFLAWVFPGYYWKRMLA